MNGESVLSAINSPSYVVQHSSGFVMDGNGKVEPGTITGISLVVSLINLGFLGFACQVNYIHSLPRNQKKSSFEWILEFKANINLIEIRFEPFHSFLKFSKWFKSQSKSNARTKVRFQFQWILKQVRCSSRTKSASISKIPVQLHLNSSD